MREYATREEKFAYLGEKIHGMLTSSSGHPTIDELSLDDLDNMVYKLEAILSAVQKIESVMTQGGR